MTRRIFVVAYVRRGDLVLVRRRRSIEVPGGEVEVGETIARALRRMVSEETGLVVTQAHLCAIYDAQPDEFAGVTFLWRVDAKRPPGRHDDPSHDEWIWVRRADVLADPADCLSLLRQWIGATKSLLELWSSPRCGG